MYVCAVLDERHPFTVNPADTPKDRSPMHAALEPRHQPGTDEG